MQGEIEPSMKERLESLKNLSMLTSSGILGMDFFPKTKYYSLNLTITWDRVYRYIIPVITASIEVPKTEETSRESKKKEYVVKWAAGGSLENELTNIRPREKWCKLSGDSGRIFKSRDSIKLLQTQIEDDQIHSVRLTLEVDNVYVDTVL